MRIGHVALCHHIKIAANAHPVELRRGAGVAKLEDHVLITTETGCLDSGNPVP
jgi:hypothetical protein